MLEPFTVDNICQVLPVKEQLDGDWGKTFSTFAARRLVTSF